jgi:hypothetical protein
MQPTVSHHDPARMTAEKRVAEIGRILFAGYLRVVRRRAANRLESVAPESTHRTDAESAKEVA